MRGKTGHKRTFAAVVIGASAGGFEALSTLLSPLPGDFSLPLLIVQHLHPTDGGRFSRHLDSITRLSARAPWDKENIRPGTIYLAPANYHMLVEKDGSIALSVDAKVKWSRPAIDVLFESAARAWGSRLIAVLLTGANDDGTHGMTAVRKKGGLTLAQAPETAEYPVMPQAAIDADAAERVMPLAAITATLIAQATPGKRGKMTK